MSSHAWHHGEELKLMRLQVGIVGPTFAVVSDPIEVATAIPPLHILAICTDELTNMNFRIEYHTLRAAARRKAWDMQAFLAVVTVGKVPRYELSETKCIRRIS
jgi:hypothetical protein